MIFSQKDYLKDGPISAFPYSLMAFAISDDPAE